MNTVAIGHYEEGEDLLQSNLLKCHNEESQEMMIDILSEMKNGLDEKLIIDNEKHRIFMRAVRDGKDNLIGYFERYEPPQEK